MWNGPKVVEAGVVAPALPAGREVGGRFRSAASQGQFPKFLRGALLYYFIAHQSSGTAASFRKSLPL